MLTTKKSLGLVAAVLMILPMMNVQAADAAGKGARLAAWDARIEKHIEHLGERISKHPKMNETVKADINKLITDLTAKKGTVEKLEADVAAKDKNGIKGDRAVIKTERTLDKNDRETLHADHKAARIAHKAAKGQKGAQQ